MRRVYFPCALGKFQLYFIATNLSMVVTIIEIMATVSSLKPVLKSR